MELEWNADQLESELGDTTGTWDQTSRIKRPMNAFMVWAQQERHKMATSEPRLHNSKISRLLGQRWQLMSAADRLPFTEQAQRLRQAHQRDHPNYKFQPKRRLKGRASKQDASCPSLSSATSVSDDDGHQHPFSQHSRFFRTVLGKDSTSPTSKFTIVSNSSLHDMRNLPVRLTINQSFKDKLRSNRTRHNIDTTQGVAKHVPVQGVGQCSSLLAQEAGRPMTPSTDDGYEEFRCQLRHRVMSTPQDPVSLAMDDTYLSAPQDPVTLATNDTYLSAAMQSDLCAADGAAMVAGQVFSEWMQCNQMDGPDTREKMDLLCSEQCADWYFSDDAELAAAEASLLAVASGHEGSSTTLLGTDSMDSAWGSSDSGFLSLSTDSQTAFCFVDVDDIATFQNDLDN